MTEFLSKKNKDESSGKRDLKARNNHSPHILLLENTQGYEFCRTKYKDHLVLSPHMTSYE